MSDGIAIVLIILYVLVVPDVGSSWINSVTVASAVAWILVYNIDFILTSEFGDNNSTVTPVDPVIL